MIYVATICHHRIHTHTHTTYDVQFTNIVCHTTRIMCEIGIERFQVLVIIFLVCLSSMYRKTACKTAR